MAKTTQTQFKYFQKCCDEYIEFFGLKNWTIYYQLYDFEDRSLAEVHWKIPGNVATIYLAAQDDSDVAPFTMEQLRATALHEIVHLVLTPLYDCATNRYTSETEVDTACEQAVRNICNVITFPRAKK